MQADCIPNNDAHAHAVDVQDILTQRMEHVIVRERLTSALRSELMPLLERHYVAISGCPDVPLEPRWDVYASLQDMGKLVVFTARAPDTRRLIGYVAFLIDWHLHYASLLVATQDVLWIDAQYRAGSTIGSDLLRTAEDHLRELDVDLILQHSKVAHPIDALLLRRGYRDLDHTWAKRI
jgi:ribosomal protein S18 acetylase RimI-like enzyme